MSKVKDQKIKDLQEENLSLKEEVTVLKSLLTLAKFGLEIAGDEIKKLSKNQKSN